MNAINRLGLLGLAMALSACSVLENDKIDYNKIKAMIVQLTEQPNAKSVTKKVNMILNMKAELERLSDMNIGYNKM